MPETPDPKLRPHPFHLRNTAHGAPNTPGLRSGLPDPSRSNIAYAELAVTTNFTFLTGASHPEEMVGCAAALGHAAVAITDTNTLAGIVRAHVEAKERGVRLIVGCRLALAGPDRLEVLVYPTSRAAYGRLCRLLTLGKRRAPKGECHLSLDDLAEHAEGLLAVSVPREINDAFAAALRRLRGVFDDDRLSLALFRGYGPDDAGRVRRAAELAGTAGVSLVAINDAHYHVPQRRALQDVLTCVRHGCTVEEAGRSLLPNAERHLKPPEEMARLFAEYPSAIARTAEIAARTAAFTLDDLRYEYPVEPCPPGMTPFEYLAQRTGAGARRRYPGGVPDKVQRQLRHELDLIRELRYEPYFLTCDDIVAFARSKGILCQGRGGAANSAVCYCLGITEVDPAKFSLLFERFVSRARGEPPDIDIDFEHERREEVIQYLYTKYGRDRAALTAEVITYRGRSAVRDVGKALGLSLDAVDALAKNLDRWREPPNAQRVAEAGFNAEDPTISRVLALTNELLGFPRHLSQHVGGFVITRAPLCELVPIENAAMEDRTVIEWDKDDIDAMGMLKVDVLGLGMLTCMEKALELLEATERRSDGATKGGDCSATSSREMNDDDTDVSRLDRLAEEHGTCEDGLPCNRRHAGIGTVRSDQSDAASGGIRALQHRRGTWPPEPSGLSEIPQSGSRLADGTRHPVRTRNIHEHAPDRPGDSRPHQGDGPSPAGIDTQFGSQVAPKFDRHSLIPGAPHLVSPSSLRRSVASSLDRFRNIIRTNDPRVYDMICRADTIGVFQIESRAQMSMLPRLKPREFYDLVIEVAIVRPGPIQGKMVHPYLRRRNGEEEVHYPSPEVKEVLGRTLGVPLFQEQAMQLAIVAAGFTADEADQLRRAMAAWRRKGDKIALFGEKLIGGMTARGYPREFAERCFEQIKGFSEYGFPESHAASFALLVYASAWLKHHHPAAFAAALINSQPMGFYQPAQIVRDAQEHGVQVRPVDVNRSGWDCTLERDKGTEGQRDRGIDGFSFVPLSLCPSVPSLRLGLRLIKGLSHKDAEKIAGAVRERGPFSSVEALWRASGVPVAALRRLAAADAFGSMGLDRQAALWSIRPLRDEPLPLFEHLDGATDEGIDALPDIPPQRRVLHDYHALGLSLKDHPVSFMRTTLAGRGCIPASDLRDERLCPSGRDLAVAGIVLVRQRPGTASGVVFMTLEDETGIANLVIWPKVFERYSRVGRLSTVLLARGKVERQGEVVHIHAQHLESLDDHLTDLPNSSRDFH